MNTALLILLVGDLTAPFQGPLVDALPVAFPEAVPEVARGLEAPPGRTVAWVRALDDGLEVEIVLHTALVSGELRRVVHFTAGDAVADRARAVAFTLAAMVRERDADLRATAPARPAPPQRSWVLDVSVPAGFDVPGLHGGAGLASHLRREVVPWFSLGVGAETAFFAGPSALLVQPSFFAEGAIAALRGPLVLSLLVGGGVSAMVFSRGGANLTAWLPMLRLGLEGRWAFGTYHGLRFALTTHLVPSTVSVEVGGIAAGTVGAVSIRPELGYFVEL